MSPATRRILWSLALGLAVYAITLYWRDFPPRLALLSGVSVSIFIYSLLQASERLRRLYRR
jgi:hypothetical protein